MARRADGDSVVNEVRLRGRLSAPVLERELPSGDVLASFRLVVERDTRREAASPKVDTLDCVAFRADVRRRLARWAPGDVVEVQGALRRRFFRTGSGAASRYEVEVRTASRVARGAAEGRDTMAG
jgi:single-strand DNA-binding protein